jgi:hypothetical protein
VRVYCAPGYAERQRSVLEQMKRDAAPFRVEIVSGPAPTP